MTALSQDRVFAQGSVTGSIRGCQNGALLSEYLVQPKRLFGDTEKADTKRA